MTSPRHLFWFLSLGLFWGVSQSVYRHLFNIGMPITHTICIAGLGVGVIMWGMAAWRGRAHIPWTVHRYGMVCGVLLNVPFGFNLLLVEHVAPTELSIIITTSPFFNYLLALVTGWEIATPRRLLAIATGFLSTLILIVSREGMQSGNISWWHIAALVVPLFYCFYNSYAARAFPVGADTLQLGAVESVWSGVFILPFLLWFAPFGAAGQPLLWHYWVLGALIAMWVVERIAYFILIRDKGAVYTVQATYIATPAAVLIAGIFFGGTQDVWLWVSLAILMLALYLNNSGQATKAPTLQSA